MPKRDLNILYARALLNYGEDAQMNQLTEEIGELLVALLGKGTRVNQRRALEESADVTILLHQMAVMTGHTIEEFNAAWTALVPDDLALNLAQLLVTLNHYRRGRLNKEDLFKAVCENAIFDPKKYRGPLIRAQQDRLALRLEQDGKSSPNDVPYALTSPDDPRWIQDLEPELLEEERTFIAPDPLAPRLRGFKFRYTLRRCLISLYYKRGGQETPPTIEDIELLLRGAEPELERLRRLNGTGLLHD